MTSKRLAMLSAVVALAATPVTPAAASAAEPPTPTASEIIAILIGQFTPPIGTDKGSLLDAPIRPHIATSAARPSARALDSTALKRL